MNDTTAAPVSVQSPAQENNGASKVKRSRAARTLPTDRIKFDKQLDMLRAYASASGLESKPVSNGHVARIIEMTEQTVSLANGFFLDAGLIVKGDGGYIPSQAVENYKTAFEFGDPAVAAHKLAGCLSTSWWMERLRPRLSFKPLSEDEALADLAEEARAGQHHRAQLRILLEFGIASGLLARDNGMVRLGRQVAEAAPAASDASATSGIIESKVAIGARPAAVATIGPAGAEGMVQFQVNVRVSMSEFAGWDPQRITAFFSGIAQVLAAKGAVTEDKPNA